jgi:hypothetical protein
MPASFTAANHNTNGSQLVGITPWSSSINPVPWIGTQQKGDFNLDGYTDLLWRNMSTGQNMLWPMTNINTMSCGGGVMSNGIAALANTGWVISGTADFTGDCNNDIVWTMPGTTNVLLWTMEGPSFICSNWLPALPGTNYGIAGTGDFNGDGKADLLITNSGFRTIRLMNGTNLIRDINITTVPPTSTAQIVGVGNFTAGEQADILWHDYATGSNFVWMMQGTSYSSTVNYLYQADTNWLVQGLGDFNGDGITDIVWRHGITGSNQLWLTGMPLGQGYTNVNLPQITNLNWTIAGPK